VLNRKQDSGKAFADSEIMRYSDVIGRGGPGVWVSRADESLTRIVALKKFWIGHWATEPTSPPFRPRPKRPASFRASE